MELQCLKTNIFPGKPRPLSVLFYFVSQDSHSQGGSTWKTKRLYIFVNIKNSRFPVAFINLNLFSLPIKSFRDWKFPRPICPVCQTKGIAMDRFFQRIGNKINFINVTCFFIQLRVKFILCTLLAPGANATHIIHATTQCNSNHMTYKNIKPY